MDEVIKARPNALTKHFWDRRFEGEPIGGRVCSCGTPCHVVRMQRPSCQKRYDDKELSVDGPWVECVNCCRWKELL